MTLRLPTPSAAYNPQEMNEAFRSIEAILRQLLQSTDALPDPAKSLNNFRAIAETDKTITYAWAPGDSVIGVWIYELDAAAPLAADPWAALPATPGTRLARDVVQLTVNKPQQGFYHIAKFEPRLTGSLAAGRPVKLTIVPAQASFGAAIHAAVTNGTADLSIDWHAGQGDLPVRIRVYEGDPIDPPIVDTTVTTGTSGSFDKTTQSALGARPLPLRALNRWWARLTNAAGVEVWNGPAAADRDPLPSGAVTGISNALRCEYDDDTDVIKITTPSGKTKTFSGLTGGGTTTYTVGDALDDASSEAALVLDEVRDGYKVEYTGGGVTLVAWRGSLKGPVSPHAMAVLQAAVSAGLATLTLTMTGSLSCFPCTVNVYADTPFSAAVYTNVFAAAGSVTPAALTNIALPLAKMKKWYVKITDPNGTDRWFGPTAADRDTIPGGEVSAGGNVLRCTYDEDTDTVKVTVPGGKTKTWSGLSGGGTQTYTVGDTLDDATTEVALAADEVRDGYHVDYIGGGKTLNFYNGPLRGPNKDFTPPSLDVTVTELGDRYTITYSAPGGTVSYRIDSGAWASAPSSPFDVFRTSADRVLQLKAVGSNGMEGDPRTITIPALAGSAGGGGSFSTLTNVLHDATTNTIDFGWAWSGDTATFRVWVRDPVRFGDTVYHFFATTSSGATLYTYTTTADLTTNHADPTDDFGFYLEAVVGSTIDARSIETVTTYNHI